MKRWIHAIALLTLGASSVFALQAIHAEPADQEGIMGGTPGDHRPHLAPEEIDFGQKRKYHKLTEDERWVRKNYPETASTKGQILVFSAKWCGPCRRYDPIVAALKGRYNVLKYDYDTERGHALYKRLGGEGVPYTVILVEGKIKHKLKGPQKLHDVEQIAVDCRKEKKDGDKTRNIDIGPLNIDIDPDGNVDINFRRRDRP